MATIEQIKRDLTKKYLESHGYELKCETKTLIKVDYGDLERFIDKVINNGLLEEVAWRGSYEIVAEQEWNNDESHEINVEKAWCDKYPVSEYNLKQLAEGKKVSFQLSAIMQLMAEKGIIQHGTYLIHVSW